MTSKQITKLILSSESHPNTRRLHFQDAKKIVQNENIFWVIAIEDLIIAKLIWIQELFSERQANDIHHLLRNPEIDKTYLLDWCSKMHLKTFDLL